MTKLEKWHTALVIFCLALAVGIIILTVGCSKEPVQYIVYDSDSIWVQNPTGSNLYLQLQDQCEGDISHWGTIYGIPPHYCQLTIEPWDIAHHHTAVGHYAVFYDSAWNKKQCTKIESYTRMIVYSPQ